MREIWDLQIQMQRRGGKRAQKLFQHPRFRAAYDFILLREQAGEDLDNLGEWWTLYQEASLEEKEQMSKDVSNLRKKVGRVTTSNSTKSRKTL
jgi:poly(A) polymerase